MRKILLLLSLFVFAACAGVTHTEPVYPTAKGTAVNTDIVQAALFDIDGTILDSMPYWNHLAENYLTARGIKPEPGLYKIVAKMSLAEGAAYLKKEYDLPEGVVELQTLIMADIGDQYRYSIPLKPGVEEFLKKLKKKGVKMAVATSSDKELVAAALKRLGIYKYFDIILTSDEIGRGKTSPLIYNMCANHLNATPEHTLVFEDAAYAIKTAHDAGYIVIAVEDEQALKDKPEILLNSAGYIATYDTLILK